MYFISSRAFGSSRSCMTRSLPLSALPLSALPLSALPLSALPLSALPESALPESALPLSALPDSAACCAEPTGSSTSPGVLVHAARVSEATTRSGFA